MTPRRGETEKGRVLDGRGPKLLNVPLRLFIPNVTSKMKEDFRRERLSRPCTCAPLRPQTAPGSAARHVVHRHRTLCSACREMLRIAEELEAGASTVELACIKARSLGDVTRVPSKASVERRH